MSSALIDNDQDEEREFKRTRISYVLPPIAIENICSGDDVSGISIIINYPTTNFKTDLLVVSEGVIASFLPLFSAGEA